MRILVVADGRSPTTRGWVRNLAALQYDVVLVSTYPCEQVIGAAETHFLPVAFGSLAGSQAGRRPAQEQNAGLAAAAVSGRSLRRSVLGRFRSAVLAARYLLGPVTLPLYARRLKKIIRTSAPDLVHALRIPFEGMLATAAQPTVPLVVSIWGNDLTLHARGSSSMRRWTLHTLRRANGLVADARRDIRLGLEWGFSPQRPTAVLPGAGGIDLFEMHRLRSLALDGLNDLVPPDLPVVVNARGFRPGSVRTDVFFEAIPLVLERQPRVAFVCTGMAGQAEAIKYIQRWNLHDKVILLPFLQQARLWGLFQRAQVNLSVSSHDGTPNSLLEAMACGCFPVAGDIESIREWITPGVNGLLVEPDKAQSVAGGVLTALDQPALRSRAAEHNAEVIRTRAETSWVRSQMGVFYQRVVENQP